ncbi:hypothetical protein BDB01DRAFT_212935 [Pilobolus umbonatus]|nr:hypothetical protein BDB01DRAFT_212935 [Pilobolus umbonatus]
MCELNTRRLRIISDDCQNRDINTNTVAEKSEDTVCTNTQVTSYDNDSFRHTNTGHINTKINSCHNRKRSTEIIAIHGNTGVGKSTLVRNVQHMAGQYGYTAIAKFDTRQPTPYGCILRCLSILLKNVLTEPCDQIKRFTCMLKNQLGPDGIAQLPTLLIDNIPELSSFLDYRPTHSKANVRSNSNGSDCDVEGGEIKMRFHTAFTEIFQVVVDFKFVTLFLEDLHQADEASIELLDSLIFAKLDLLIILTYRNGEISSSVSKLLRNENSVVNYVKIDNLDQVALMDLVRTTMHRLEDFDTIVLAPLVDFIYKRTHGNPFYTCQLLMTLEKKNLIYFTWSKKRWEYNLQEIDKAHLLDMKDDANGEIDIRFLVERFKELPRDGRRFLKWASFIGNTFHFETVRDLMMENTDDSDLADSSSDEEDEEESEAFSSKKKSPLQSKIDVINGLQSTLQLGFIQGLNHDEFRFVHDRYSQAVMRMISAEKKYVLHLKIASFFMEKDQMDTFWVADHLKIAIHLISQYEVKTPYRNMLIKAGDKAFDSGAHSLAYSYYSAAQKILSEDPWQDSDDSTYCETLHLYTRLSEISWFMNNDLTRDYLNAILENAHDAIDRAAAYRIQHRHRWSRLGNQESAPILLECLRELGVNDIALDLPDDGLKKLYELTRKEVLQMGFNNILKLSMCNERLIRTRFSIMEELCLWGYWANDMKVMLAVGSRLVLKTLKHGITPSTGVGFVLFGIAVMHLFKAYEFGEQIGEVGVFLCNSHGGISETGRARYLYSVYLSLWKYPYHQSVPMSRLAMKQCLLGGDRIHAIFAHIYVVTLNLLNGDYVSDTLREAKLCLEETKILGGNVGTAILAITIIRVALALQGKTRITQVDEIFNDEEFLESVFIANAMEIYADVHIQLHFYYLMKSITLAFYGFDEEAIETGEKCVDQLIATPSARQGHLMYFYRCISFIRLIRSGKLGIDSLEQVEKFKSVLEEWARHSHPDNINMLICFLDAEIASLKNEDRRAQQSYDSAIRCARAGKAMIELHFFYEQAGEYYLRIGLPSVAASFLEKAIKGFRHIGILGKVAQIENKHKHLINDFQSFDAPKVVSVQTEMNITSSKAESISGISLDSDEYPVDMSNTDMQKSAEQTLLTLDVVDLASILKSSQVISSEMNFELLMKQMLGIILENSGAESGVIIIKENTSYLIMGSGSQTHGCEIYNTPKLLSEEIDSIVTRISYYTIHSQESLFIFDVQQDSRFSDCTTQAKSCICTPIIHKSAVLGCIYIEGAVGSLTPRHEVVLRLLSQQIGISVTNALLFKSIQKVTCANLRMIESQKAALEEARKSKEAALRAMKLKANFLANMSHELRTPFSGFYGMISLLSETVLDAEQADIVNTAKDSCEMLLKIIDDLLNFSKLEAGKVTLNTGPLIIEEVIADTIETLGSISARKGLELTYIVDTNVPSTVIGDISRFRQVLTNLLGNAIKFTHEGGVVIRCCIDSVLDDDYLRLKIEVIDTGIGILPEQQRQLFEPFSQVDGSTTRMYGGTGLGLSICLQLVRLMKGDIGVKSEYGVGSNFWFTLIVKKEEGEKSNAMESIKSLSILHTQNILFATSSKLNASMICSLLSDFKVQATSNMGQAIFQAIQQNCPLLIIDIPHNPTPSISVQLQNLDDVYECNPYILLLYTPSTEGHKLATEATNSKLGSRRKIIKMPKPARRIKLLRLLDEIFGQQGSRVIANLPASVRTGMKDYFSEEELSSFSEKPVLIAEDNMIAQKLLRKQLQKMGFVVESANNGEEAIKLWKQRPSNYYYIGFFDHHMPKCDGVEATKRIRELEGETESRLPIIALTADIQTSTKEICAQAGMDSYLTKPLIPKDLADTLRKLSPVIHNHYFTSPTP